MHVADSSGVMREVVDVLVSDGLTWRDVADGWTADSDGVLRHWAAFGGAVTVGVTAIDHLSFRISWESVGSDLVTLQVNGSTVHTSDADSGWVVVGNQTPASTVSVTAVATFGTSTITSDAVLHTLANIPGPGYVGWGLLTATSVSLSWGAVSGATSYEVYNANTHSMLVSTTQLTWAWTGLTAGTAYSVYVKARFSPSVLSAASPSTTFTTVATFAAGTYTFTANDCDTRSPGTGAWRGTSTGEVWHGYYSSTHGKQGAWFFDYKNAAGQSIYDFFLGGAPANITKFEVYIKRVSTNHGSWSPQTCWIYKHNHSTQPAYASAAVVGSGAQAGTLDLGEAKWIALDKAWAAEFIAGTAKGLVWGAKPSDTGTPPYMIGPTLAVLPSQMQIRITVG